MRPLSHFLSVPTVAIAAVMALTGTAAADTPTYGADTSGPGPNGSFTTGYTEPNCPGDYYDNYFYQVGSAVSGGTIYHAPSTSGYDNQSYMAASWDNYVIDHGSGPAAYFFLNGPLSAPSGTSAATWGYDQAYAAATYANDAAEADYQANGSWPTFDFLFGDVETDPQDSLYFNGWSTSPTTWSPNYSANQAVWNNFYQDLQTWGWNVGVYSSQGNWDATMGSQAWPVYTVEWTSDQHQTTPGSCATSMWQNTTYSQTAQFYGGDSESSTNALVWQWIVGDADYDQTDLTHWNTLFGLSYTP